MRIAFLDASTLWSGGAADVLLLARSLSSRGHETYIFCLPWSELYRRAREYREVRTVGIGARIDIDPVAFGMLYRWFEREAIEIVDIVSPRFYWIGTLAGRASGAKVVLTRNVDYKIQNRWINGLLYRNFVDRIVAVSGAVRRTLMEDVGVSPDKISTIYRGIDPSVHPNPESQVALRRELGITDNSVVGTTARLVPMKGVKYLVEAAKLVLEEIPNAKFLIVGEGPERGGLEKLARNLGVAESVIFTGFQSDIDGILSIIDLFVLPSLFEALGVSIVEAMKWSLPVVATDVNGVPEVVEDGVTGILVPPRDPRALADGVIFLLRNPDVAREMGKRGRRKMEGQFDVRRLIDETERLYKTLASSSDGEG
ncbi:MAG: glycosyltransferase family 4 protein [bacterium]